MQHNDANKRHYTTSSVALQTGMGESKTTFSNKVFIKSKYSVFGYKNRPNFFKYGRQQPPKSLKSANLG